MALTPQAVEKLVRLGAAVTVEAGIGASLWLADAVYAKAGAAVVQDRAALLRSADALVALRGPTSEILANLTRGSDHHKLPRPVPRNGHGPGAGRGWGERHQHGDDPALDQRPEDGRASSQANLAGYVAVRPGGRSASTRSCPMMMTPAGTHRARARLRHRRRRRRLAGHRHGQAAGRARRGLRHPPRGRGAGRIARRASFARDRPRRDRADQGRLRQGSSPTSNSRQQRRRMAKQCARVRHRHHHRPGLRPQGAGDRHRRDGRRA